MSEDLDLGDLDDINPDWPKTRLWDLPRDSAVPWLRAIGVAWDTGDEVARTLVADALTWPSAAQMPETVYADLVSLGLAPMSTATTLALKHAAHNQKDHGIRYGPGGGGYRERDMTEPHPYTDKMVAEALKHFERAGLTSQVQARNLERILDRTPASTVEAGKLWYPGARAEAKTDADELGYPLRTAVGIYAANAQNTEWADGPWRNGQAPASFNQPAARTHMEIMRGMHGDRLDIRRDDAERIWQKEITSTSPNTRNNAVKAWDYDGIETDKHGMNFTGRGIPLGDLPADLVLRHHPRSAALPEVRTRAARLARGEHPDDVLIGAKLRSMHNNMLDPSDPRFVTLDRWQVRVAAGDPAYPKGKAKLHLSNRARYEYMARPVRAVAADRDMVPNQIQAISWSQIRKEGDGD